MVQLLIPRVKVEHVVQLLIPRVKVELIFQKKHVLIFSYLERLIVSSEVS